MLGGADETLRARLLSRLACAWRSTPDRRNDSATLSRHAIDVARGLRDPATLVYTLTARFWATWWPENPGGAPGHRRGGPFDRGAARRGRAHRRCALHVVPPAERGRQDPRGPGRTAHPRAGDRGAPSASPGLARAGQPIHARPARRGLRGSRGVGGQRAPVDVLDHAGPRRGLGGTDAPLPATARTGPGVRGGGDGARIRRRLPLVSHVPIGAGVSPPGHGRDRRGARRVRGAGCRGVRGVVSGQHVAVRDQPRGRGLRAAE